MRKGPEDKGYEALYGTVVNGRYKLVKLCDQLEKASDRENGWLFQGEDMQNACEVGIRVVQTPEGHRRLHAWLAQALLSRAREAILAVGHLDRKRTYVVFSGAVLNHWKPAPDVEDEDEDELENEEDLKARQERERPETNVEKFLRARQKSRPILQRKHFDPDYPGID